MLRITLVLFIVGEAVAQVNSKLPCPDLSTVTNFNVKKFMKTWYHIAEYSDSTKVDDRCVKSEYILGDKGSFQIRTTQVSSIGNKPYDIEYTVTPLGDSRNGKFKVSSTGALYDILTTDYRSLALIWSCKNSTGGSTQSATILTTARNPTANVLDYVLRVANKKQLLKDKFLRTDQKNCPL